MEDSCRAVRRPVRARCQLDYRNNNVLGGEPEDGGICGSALQLHRHSGKKERNEKSGVLTVIQLPLWTTYKTIKDRPTQCQSWGITGIT